jgi:hypothetical protein
MCHVAKKILPKEMKEVLRITLTSANKRHNPYDLERFRLHIWWSRNHPAMPCFTVTGNCEPILMTAGLLDLSLFWVTLGKKIKKKDKTLVLWRGPCSTQRQSRELISGLKLATRVRLSSFNRAQSMAVIGLLTGHNTLVRHLYVMGPSNNLSRKKRGTDEETSVHIFVSVRLRLHSRHAHLGSFNLDPEDIKKLSIGAI